MITIPVDMACNDPDNGVFAGRIEQISIGSEFLELTARRDPIRLVELGDGRLRIAGRIWPTEGSAEWVGNWCWNRYWLAVGQALELLLWLHRRRFFHCDLAEARLFALWRLDAPLTDHADLMRRLIDKEAIHIGRAT